MGQIDWNAIKARHSLAAVARRTGLDVPGGGRAMVCCPMPDHADRDPSMQLDLDRNRYHCYGCGAHGDVVQWVQDIEHVNHSDAIRILDSGRPLAGQITQPTVRSSRTGTTPDGPVPERTPVSRIRAANRLAWQYYGSGPRHADGVAYLLGRAIDIADLEAETNTPAVGHTPSSKSSVDSLTVFMTHKGFSEIELIDASLAVRLDDGGVRDFFRHRVIFPVADGRGNVTGFVGRDVTGQSRVKYLNPSTTITYKKNQALYRPSRPTLRASGAVVVCEGPLDALAVAARAAQANMSELFAPVAACGIALSDHQIETILALHLRAPVLAGDGDQAGRRANRDWATRMLTRGRESVITDWPNGYDPAAWLEEQGPNGLLAVSRKGCLDDHSGVLRPRHCGAVLTETAFPRDDPSEPQHADVFEAVAEATAALPPAARRRYTDAATQVSTVSLPPIADLPSAPVPPERPAARHVERIEL